MRPGRHTLTLEVGLERKFGAHRIFHGACGGSGRGNALLESPLAIGFAQTEVWGFANACGAWLLQRAVLFDTTLLDQVQDKVIESAILSYDEVPFPFCVIWGYAPSEQTGYQVIPGGPSNCWTDGEGNPENKHDGCVDVRVPYGDWRTEPAYWRGAAPTATDGGEIRRVSARSWNVTVPFNYQHGSGPPLEGIRRIGFLLSGFPLTLDELTADDNTRCVSSVTNVQLQVTYYVPPTGRDFVQPN
jgi:hypothetical protein